VQLRGRGGAGASPVVGARDARAALRVRGDGALVERRAAVRARGVHLARPASSCVRTATVLASSCRTTPEKPLDRMHA
jgi:hypothetical protein